jgi:catechol 2,3-dioxygenase-like lactoylglutathione lyase family enzyme
MAAVQVRYIVNDVQSAIDFYTNQLGFQLVMHPTPAFAMLTRGDLRLVLSASNPAAGGGQPMPDGRVQRHGGWNRVGGKQVILDDPSGNPIELFEPLLPEARVG